MNFEEFKKRYIAKLQKGGFTIPTDEEGLAAFEDRAAEIYLGLMIYSEFQVEHVKKQMEQQAKAEQNPAIILPKGGIAH